MGPVLFENQIHLGTSMLKLAEQMLNWFVFIRVVSVGLSRQATPSSRP